MFPEPRLRKAESGGEEIGCGSREGTRGLEFMDQGDRMPRSQAALTSPDPHCFSQQTFTELVLLLHHLTPQEGVGLLQHPCPALQPHLLKDWGTSVGSACPGPTPPLLATVPPTHPFSSQESAPLSRHCDLIAHFTPSFKGALRLRPS